MRWVRHFPSFFLSFSAGGSFPKWMDVVQEQSWLIIPHIEISCLLNKKCQQREFSEIVNCLDRDCSQKDVSSNRKYSKSVCNKSRLNCAIWQDGLNEGHDNNKRKQRKSKAPLLKLWPRLMREGCKRPWMSSFYLDNNNNKNHPFHDPIHLFKEQNINNTTTIHCKKSHILPLTND